MVLQTCHCEKCPNLLLLLPTAKDYKVLFDSCPPFRATISFVSNCLHICRMYFISKMGSLRKIPDTHIIEIETTVFTPLYEITNCKVVQFVQ